MVTRRNIILSLTAAFLVFGIIALYTLKTHPRYYNKAKCYIRRVLGENCKTNNKTYNASFKNDRYSLHRKAAKKSGVSPLKDNQQIDKELSKNKLIKVNKGKGYRIYKLKYSKPVLTKPTYAILKKIGEDFYNSTSGCYFTVTSLTRSIASQKRLCKNNINATRNISTHSYGVSFDISYIRFNGKKRSYSRLKSKLEKILVKYRKKGKVYLICEKKTSCYHITVR